MDPAVKVVPTISVDEAMVVKILNEKCSDIGTVVQISQGHGFFKRF